MKQAGRTHWVIVAGTLGVVLVAVLFVFAKNSAAESATRFLTALGKGDVDTLVELTFLDKGSKEDLRKDWDFAVHRAGPYYIFAWKVIGVVEADSESAAVKVIFVRDLDREGYEQNVQLPMVKRDGKWLVDVRGIDRSLYPALPR